MNKPAPVDLTKLKSMGKRMSADFVELVTSAEVYEQDTVILNETLGNFFVELQKVGAEFGYRTAMEIHRLFQKLTVLNESMSTNEKVDITIMQKLLPKLHGSRRKLCPILATLAGLCVSSGVDFKKDFLENTDTADFENPEIVKFPLSLEKISRMYKGAIDNGFASYAEA